MEELFDLYDRGELKLVRSPDKTLLFQTRNLRDDDLQIIVDDITAKVEKRMAGFEAFVELIESGVDPSKVLHERFSS